MKADWEEVPFLAGQGVGLVNDVLPATEVVERMMAQAARLLDAGRTLRR
jgi:NAD(P)H-dependent flavin oxidoreductase YrpB (nitropropane dioxygenase family)